MTSLPTPAGCCGPSIRLVLLGLALLGLPQGSAAAPNYPDLSLAQAAPNPEPAPPGDSFNPPISAGLPAANCAPAFAEWTRSGAPGNSLVVTGTDFSNYGGSGLGQDTAFWVYGQTSAGNGTLLPASIQRLGAGQDRAVLTLPAGLPNSTFLLWPQNSAGLGAPVVVNQTDFWWLGPSNAAMGDSISAFGRNLSFNNVTPAVYVGPPGGPITPVTPTAWNPYKVDFQVPAGLAVGSAYQVWVHNGHGGHWGWSGPQTLTVTAATTWSGPSVAVTGADPSGSADSYPAIIAAVNAAAALAATNGNATVNFPAGNFLVSHSLYPPSNVRWVGAGMWATTLTVAANLSATACGATYKCTSLLGPDSPHTSDNVEIDNMGFDAGLNGANYLPQSGSNSNELVWLRSNNNMRFNHVVFRSTGAITFDMGGNQFTRFNNCKFIGGNNTSNTIYANGGAQSFFEGCDFYGTMDAGGLIAISAYDGLSLENCTGQDLDNSDPSNGAGWGRGRFLYGNTAYNSERHVYAGNNATYQLSPRPGSDNSSGQPDTNAGEQYLWEGNFTEASGHPGAGTGPNTLVLPSLASVTAGQSVAGFWEAIVVGGTGLGQHRRIVAYDGAATATISPPWQQVPDGNSQVIVSTVISQCVLFDNFIQGKADYASVTSSSTAIEPFGNAYDFIADGNVIQQVRAGINSFGQGELNKDLGSIEPIYFNLYTNNQVSGVLIGASSYIEGWNPAWTAYPGVMNLGNLFRGNSFNFTPIAYQLSLGNSPGVPGVQLDMNVFESNTVANAPVGVKCDASFTASPLGPQLGGTVVYNNQFNACTCGSSVAGSQGIIFGAGQTPALQANHWSNYQSNYAGSVPGPVLEAPNRVARITAFPAAGSLVLWNSGTAPLPLSLASQAAWLAPTPASGVIPAEGAFTFNYAAAAVTISGVVGGTLQASGGGTLSLLFYDNPNASAAGIGYCQPVPTPATVTAAAAGAGDSFLYPSPARGATANVAYTLAAAGHVKILVYNEVGRLVDKVEEDRAAGPQVSVLSTGKWAPGVYFYLCTLSPGNAAPQTLGMVKFAVIH